MAKKTRLFKVTIKNSQSIETSLGRPIPGASKEHVIDELIAYGINNIVNVEFRYWNDFELLGNNPSDYYFQITTRKGKTFTYGEEDLGWNHLNHQFKSHVNEMIDVMEEELGCNM